MDDDNLERRLAALRHPKTSEAASPANDDELATRFTTLFRHAPTATSSGLPETKATPQNAEDELDLQDLLDAVYEQKDTWTLSKDEEQSIAELLGQAKDLVGEDTKAAAEPRLPSLEREREGGEKSVDANEDDDEGEDILRKIRDELALEAAMGVDTAADTPVEEAGPEPLSGYVKNAADEEEDGLSELEARFKSLGPLELPAVPQKEPGRPVVQVLKEAPKPYDETETWCCICNEDAEYRCSGCENDIYCKDCLYEAHVGPDAGLEERRHKWTKYIRPKKQVAAA